MTVTAARTRIFTLLICAPCAEMHGSHG